MIRVEDLSIEYGGETLFSDVSFVINAKERCSLVGRNGSGKTTLFRMLAGHETPDRGTIFLSKGYRLGYLDQHIRFSKSSILEETLLGLPHDEKDQTYKAEKILSGLGINQVENSPHVLSGGYQLRLHLAKVLLSEPNCLLLDEPTNYLDILSRRFLSRFLQRWGGELILISHDREFLDSISTHTLGIHRQKVKKTKGQTNKFFEFLLAEEEAHEKIRVSLDKKRTHMQSYIDRLGAKASKASQTQSRKKMLDKMPALEQLKNIANLDFAFHSHPFPGKVLGEAKNISFSYTDEPDLIRDFSLTIGPRQKIAIIGKNGFGKSTLLKLLAQELVPQKGNISYANKMALGYFGQTNIDRLDPSKTIEEEVFAANPNLSTTEIRKICGRMMFTGARSEKTISMLSGGEKSRVLLGKILAKPCNLLLLDEPTHHLDIESIEALIDAIEAFPGTIIIVTHSELILERLDLDTLIVCHQNRQETFMGGYQEFLDKVGWEEEAKKEHSPGSYREQRKQRAEQIASRSKILKPIKRKIEHLEETIISLEEEQETEQALLIQASQESNNDDVQRLLKTTGEREKTIALLLEEYTSLSVDLESKQQEIAPTLEGVKRD